MKKVSRKASLLKPQSVQRINVNSRGCKPTDPASIIGPALPGPHNHPIATVGCHPRLFTSGRIAAAAIPNPRSGTLATKAHGGPAEASATTAAAFGIPHSSFSHTGSTILALLRHRY